MSLPPHFRANVGIAVSNQRGEVLAVERWPPGSNRWQMAQGGLDEGETVVAAGYRELGEELGLQPDDVELVAVHDSWLSYELPVPARRRPGGLGQTQKWLLFRLDAPESRIDLGAGDSSRDPELASWRWMRLERLAEETWSPRRPIYRELVAAWAPLLSGQRSIAGDADTEGCSTRCAAERLEKRETER